MGDKDQEHMLIEVVKTALMRMDKKFTELSRLKFDEISGELRRKLEEQKIQERPFAYEFYHQLRKMYESKNQLSSIIPEDVIVQAEVHKGYQEIPNLNRMPDFLLHKPSSNNNFAVIEFKLASRKNELKDDFDKLVAFRDILGYKYLIEIIIGDEHSLNECRKEYLRLSSNEGTEIIIIEFNTKTWRAEYTKIKYSVQ